MHRGLRWPVASWLVSGMAWPAGHKGSDGPSVFSTDEATSQTLSPEMWVSMGYSHPPFQSLKSPSVGPPGTEAVVQLHPAYTGISVYSHKPTTHVLSDLLVTRHARSTYKTCLIQKKMTPSYTRYTGIFCIHIP